MSASPESFSSTRLNTGAARDNGSFTTADSGFTDLEPGEAANHHVLAGLRGHRRPDLLDRLPAVGVLFDVLLPEQDHLVKPLVELALHDLVPHVLRAVGRLLGGDPLLT